MNWDTIDWKALERLRKAFLQGTAGESDYWHSETDLASYDETFAQRIGWKWDYVLEELKRRRWTPPFGALLDWGCGSGIASRAFLDHFGGESVSGLYVWDRSSLAMNYAVRTARNKFPSVPVESCAVKQPAVLLVSHVLTELRPDQVEELEGLARRATAILCVEPGTHEASLTLIALRERLKGQFNIVAPCTHQAGCGILAPENKSHWCHHFAQPPSEVFMDSSWARFADLAGIDLRSLPLSFLVLDKSSAPILPAGATWIIGRPRIYKGRALLLGCDAAGVGDRQLTKRALPEQFRQLKKGAGTSLQVWRCDGSEIIAAHPHNPASSDEDMAGHGRRGASNK